MKDGLTKEQREEIARQVERCAWFSAKDAMAWTLSAYYAALRAARPPPDEPWEEGLFSPSDFVWEFHCRLTETLSLEILRRGLRSCGSASAELCWEDEGPPRPIFIRWGRIGKSWAAQNDASQRNDLPQPKNPGNNAFESEAPGAA